MGSPAVRMLQPSPGAEAPVAALFGKAGRSPRVYAGRDVDALVQGMQVTAQKKLGVTLTGAKCNTLQHFLLDLPGSADVAERHAQHQHPDGDNISYMPAALLDWPDYQKDHAFRQSAGASSCSWPFVAEQSQIIWCVCRQWKRSPR